MKKILALILALALTLVAMVFTFCQTMNNLKITVNTAENGAMVECFGQIWYCDNIEIM